MIDRPRPVLTALARRLTYTTRDEQRRRARRAPIAADVVFYESFAGNGMLCNPEAIFRTLCAAPDMSHLRHVWALTDVRTDARTVAEFADDSRVSFVRRGARSYWAALSTAKYLVNNATFPEGFAKRIGQVYVNTWHGTALKAMGFDIPGGAVATRNVVRNLAAADYLLAPNADTETMFLTAYRMHNLYRGWLIAEGTPRVDHQFAGERERLRIRTRLADRGVALGASQKVLLYAPTWKGDFDTPADDVASLRTLIDAVRGQLHDQEYRVLLKVHQRVFHLARADPGLRDVLLPNDIPTNDILAVTDAVVTDYSSIFIDFLATGRPVLFYVPDLDEYTASRGLYRSPADLPGPVCRTIAELVACIDVLGSGRDDDPIVTHAAAYAAARERYCPREDGHASARVVDIVFRGASESYDVHRDCSDGRASVLIHLGGLRPNGITAAALSLLDNIDHDRLDVSVSFPHDTHADQKRMVALINPRVRLFAQAADVVAGRIRVRLAAAVNGRSPGHRQVLPRWGNDLMREEWRRAFGESRFDHVVDFSGYVPYWLKLLGARSSGSLSIWLHNDLRAELSNPDRSAHVRASLRGAIALYGGADHLVSVSQTLNEVNQVALAKWAPAESFTCARNTINAERVRQLAAVPGPAPGIPAATPEVRTFVTVGRLSPEKNHRRLIRAFAQVHSEETACRLIIVGSGPQLGHLRALVEELALGDAVTLAGHRANPYSVMAQSDCFVLSSDYEGQPIVLLEALVIGLPVVTTAFDSVRSALPDGAGLIVAQDVDALAAGMRAFLLGTVVGADFDADAWNRVAIAEFYRAIGCT